MTPQIVSEPFWQGRHNSDLQASRDRLIQGNTYKDLSTICIVPTRGMIPAKVVQSWMAMVPPMNQKFVRLFVVGMEVGQAYQNAIASILANPDLAAWKYVLTLEEDNLPPPDGLLKLYESIEKFDAVGALYWTKGEGGQPMCYGNPGVMPKNFIPFLPATDAVAQCNGLGMGFTLFRLDMFKDPKFEGQWFKTQQEFRPGAGMEVYTQDLWFFNRAGMNGYRFACDTRIKVGHYDAKSDIVW